MAILAVIFWGFFRTYFGLFPSFDKITTSQHFHTALFLLWFLLLFIQPFLIKSGKIELHRLLGKLTYILVPLLALSILAVTKGQYQRELAQFPKNQCIANLIIPLPQLFLFLVLYLLAIYHKKNTAYHMRYIISTSLILIGPGLGRAFIFWMGMTFNQAVLFSFIITELVLIGLIIFDRMNGSRYKPYVVLLTLLFSSHLAWYFLPQSYAWQAICGRFAEIVF